MRTTHKKASLLEQDKNKEINGANQVGKAACWCLQYWHPMWTPVQDPAVPVLIQLPTNVPVFMLGRVCKIVFFFYAKESSERGKIISSASPGQVSSRFSLITTLAWVCFLLLLCFPNNATRVVLWKMPGLPKLKTSMAAIWLGQNQGLAMASCSVSVCHYSPLCSLSNP